MNWRKILTTQLTPPIFGWKWGDLMGRDLVPSFLRGPRRRGLVGSGIHFIAWFSQQWRKDMRAAFTQMNAVVRTNSVLPEGLEACAEDAPNRRIARVLRRLSARMAEGASLSQAMATMPQCFCAHWIDLVRAGEGTGALDRALTAIVDELKRDLEQGRRSKNRIAYFAWLIVTQVLILSFLVIKVFPVFAEIYGEFGQPLPRSMALLFWTNDHAQQYFRVVMMLLGVLVLGSLIGPFLYRRVGLLQSAVIYGLLRVPLIGGLVRKKNLMHIASILETSLAGGVPLPEALRAAAASHISRPFSRAVERAAECVEQGVPLSESLARDRYLFGELMHTLVKLGEQSGRLDRCCGQARELYHRDIVRTESGLADALVPLGVFVCGTIVLLASISTYSITIVTGEALMNSM